MLNLHYGVKKLLFVSTQVNVSIIILINVLVYKMPKNWENVLVFSKTQDAYLNVKKPENIQIILKWLID